MATKLVRYDLRDNRSILVEEEIDDRDGLVGRGDVVETAKAKFEEALASVRPAVEAVLEAIEGLVSKPDEITLELGISLRGEVGAVIAKTALEGSFKLSLKWKPQP